MGAARPPRGDRPWGRPTPARAANRIIVAVGASVMIGSVFAWSPSLPGASAQGPDATETPAAPTPTFAPRPRATPTPQPSQDPSPGENTPADQPGVLPDPPADGVPSNTVETSETPTPSPSPTPTWGPSNPNAYWLQRAREIAKQYWLGEYFVRQVMLESGFNDDVISGRRVSSAGAEGIAQIMRKYHPTVDPLDPEAALNYAARHMYDLLWRYEGDMTKALAAYNAGSVRVQAAIHARGDAWLGAMPEHTQRYVALIMWPGDSPGKLPRWDELMQWWLRATEELGQRLHLRLVLGKMVAVTVLPPPPES